MKETIKIKKCRKIEIIEETQLAHLEPEAFRNIESCPFKGSTEEEFLKYIQDIQYEPLDDLDEFQKMELDCLFENADWETVSSSLDKGEDSWLEVEE